MARQYSDETKAAVMAALLAGQSISYVAKEYDIPAGTVKSWRARSMVAPVATEKKAEIGDLVLRYLHANLTALEAQAIVFSDPDWLEKQEADQAAVLHGVMTDKAIRLLEALSNARSGD
jgi:hypothetical protein